MEAPACTKATPCADCVRELTFDNQPRCIRWATSTGHRCERARTPGTTICHKHGSNNPGIRRNAQLRLVELIDPAIATLAREMTTAKGSADRQRAANSLLDRAGVPRRTEVDYGAAQALLVARLSEVLGRRNNPPALEQADPGQEPVDAEIVPDERMEA